MELQDSALPLTFPRELEPGQLPPANPLEQSLLQKVLSLCKKKKRKHSALKGIKKVHTMFFSSTLWE
jgi:hypothetical protein